MKGPIEYIKEAFKIYTKKENFLFFAKIMAVLTIISTIISYSHSYISRFVLSPINNSVRFNFDDIPLTILFILIAIFSFIFYFYSTSTTYMSVLNLGMNEKEVFKLGYKKTWKLFVITLVFGLIVSFGAILLVIPALIFSVWYMFSVLLVLDKNMKIGEALKQSKMMVKGKFWAVLGRSLVFGLFGFVIGFVVAFIPYAGSIIVSFLAPLFILPSYLLYRDLSAGLKDLGTI